MKFETRAVHAGLSVDENTGAIAPPIHLSTTFGRDEASQPIGRHTYIRESNPNQERLEQAVAELEGGEAGLAFASGMAAGAAVFEALEPGTHMVIPDDVYYGFGVAAQEFCNKWGITFDAVPMEDLDQLSAAIRPETGLIWVETPSNPLLKVVDIRRITALARQADATTIVDNTFATPALQRPIECGADIVLHSATKYFGGHSDVAGGCLVFARRSPLFEATERAQHILGASLAPFNSWLILRGLRTLACRMQAQSAGALVVAQSLEGHPNVRAVHYPGLESHPGHEIAKGQMSSFGAMLSFRVRQGREAALSIVGRSSLFVRATSLGGVESLIEHRATSEGDDATSPEDLIRLSIGLEHPDDLIEDLGRALCPV
jgi:cystathionine gamma-synthase